MNENPLAPMERCIHEALTRRASDLFLLPGEPPLIRVDDAIERTDRPVLEAAEIRRIAEALVGAERLETIGPEVGEIVTRNGIPEEANARLTIARSQGELTLSLVFLPREVYPPADLGIPEALLNAVSAPSGLTVITGPLGSGMQTVSYSLLDSINGREACHICTVEDPILVRLTPRKSAIQQREIGVDVPDGRSGIRAAARQDADVIYVNQVRAVEEVEACIAAVESGRRAIIVLHTATTPEGAVQRLVDAIPEDARSSLRRGLAPVLRCVSSQRLLPRADGQGRIAAFGLLVPDAEMRRALAEGEDWRARSTPWPAGCLSLPDEIRRLEREGVVSAETAKKALAEFMR